MGLLVDHRPAAEDVVGDSIETGWRRGRSVLMPRRIDRANRDLFQQQNDQLLSGPDFDNGQERFAERRDSGKLSSP